VGGRKPTRRWRFPCHWMLLLLLQAANPAGSYKNSSLSQRISARASYYDINFASDIHINVRHHGMVSGLSRYRNHILDSITGNMPC
jgi:hypothetical protein